MGIAQKIKDKEREQEAQKQLQKQKARNFFFAAPVVEKSKILIPVIKSALKVVAREYNYWIRETDSEFSDDSNMSSPNYTGFIAKYELFVKKTKWLIFSEKTFFIKVRVFIGYGKVSIHSSNEFELRHFTPISISVENWGDPVYCRGYFDSLPTISIYDDSRSLANSLIPNNEHQIDEWFSDKLVALFMRVGLNKK